MPHYVLLMEWTDAGVDKAIGEEARNSGTMILGVKRALEDQLANFNGGVPQFLCTLGVHDMVAIVEADSDISVAGVALWLAREQGVHTTTMRAYNSADIGSGTTPAALTVTDVLYRCYAGADDGGGNGG